MTSDDNQKPEPETPKAEDAPEPKAKPKAASKPKATVQDADPSFTHDRLVRECAQAIGHPSHVVAGALAGEKKETLTINEAKSACDKWLKAQKR